MIDPELVRLFWTIASYACCGSVVAVVSRYWNRKEPGPSLDQAAAVGAGVGAGFGALVGIFSGMLDRL